MGCFSAALKSSMDLRPSSSSLSLRMGLGFSEGEIRGISIGFDWCFRFRWPEASSPIGIGPEAPRLLLALRLGAVRILLLLLGEGVNYWH